MEKTCILILRHSSEIVQKIFKKIWEVIASDTEASVNEIEDPLCLFKLTNANSEGVNASSSTSRGFWCS